MKLTESNIKFIWVSVLFQRHLLPNVCVKYMNIGLQHMLVILCHAKPSLPIMVHYMCRGYINMFDVNASFSRFPMTVYSFDPVNLMSDFKKFLTPITT